MKTRLICKAEREINLYLKRLRTLNATGELLGLIGSIQMFEANLLDNLNALMRELKTRGTFQPKPLRLRRVFIPKGKGKMRPLGIPAVTELHFEVLRQLLSRIDDPLFHEDSYGFRLSVISLAQLSSDAEAGVGPLATRLQRGLGRRHSGILR
uniref:Reverse transcriptase (RNA-dependent DNA polymerase) n=1 Tax=Candidatus Kentrum sp. MB TaxID=2138164 RepID=A0A451B8P2_9GAMM|nr:MAG: hypothetical protein BECKMB1821I_GA0114274_10089 [Candidatus Kentron sp. MB]VFK31481.1 MAG: hypothetical protein BECKMB1821G_GA0114241_10858 [Candidatus Kentron sp. MB]VFK74650.1 MAG: hypothetical protein BECKMB1821H_GA0114242_10089 [Candidatus Kentron sp. MB]